MMQFTPRTLTAFGHAETEARAFGHPSIGSQHLVLGLFLLGSGVHFSVLRQLGFDLELLRRDIAELKPIAEDTKPIDRFMFGMSAVQAVARASREAEAMAFTYIG